MHGNRTGTLLQTSRFPCMYCYFASDWSVSMHVLLHCFRPVDFHACIVTLLQTGGFHTHCTVILLQTGRFPCMYCYFASNRFVSMHVLLLYFRPVCFYACTVTLLQTSRFPCMYCSFASDRSVSMHAPLLYFRPVGFPSMYHYFASDWSVSMHVLLLCFRLLNTPTLRERLCCDFGYRSNSNGLLHMLKVPTQS